MVLWYFPMMISKIIIIILFGWNLIKVGGTLRSKHMETKLQFKLLIKSVSIFMTIDEMPSKQWTESRIESHENGVGKVLIEGWESAHWIYLLGIGNGRCRWIHCNSINRFQPMGLRLCSMLVSTERYHCLFIWNKLSVFHLYSSISTQVKRKKPFFLPYGSNQNQDVSWLNNGCYTKIKEPYC